MNKLSKILFLTVLVTVGSSAIAAAPSEAVLHECTSLSEMAKGIMEARQGEVSMAKMMAIKTGEKYTDDLSATLVEDAYSKSAYSSPENKQSAVSEFENKWFAACLRSKSST